MTLRVPSKQPCTIKTIIYNDIFTSLRRKKIQIPAKQFKELFSLCPNQEEWMMYNVQAHLNPTWRLVIDRDACAAFWKQT